MPQLNPENQAGGLGLGLSLGGGGGVVIGATAGADFTTWTYDVSAPAWVVALKAPSGALPLVAADFKNGRYWVRWPSSSGLGALWLSNLAWGPFNANTIISGKGLGSDFNGANDAQPTLSDAAFSLLTPGFTALQVLTGATPPSAGTCSSQCYFEDLPDFNTERVSQISVLFDGSTSSVTSVSCADAAGTDEIDGTSPTSAGTYGIAANQTYAGCQWALDGVAQTGIAGRSVTVDPTNISISVVSELDSASPEAAFGWLEMVVFWAVQPNGDLPALSDLRTPP